MGGFIRPALGRQHYSPKEEALLCHCTVSQREGGAIPQEEPCHAANCPTPLWTEKGNRRILEAELEVENGVDASSPIPIPTPTPYLDVPVLIQVIDTGDAAPIAVGIVNMPHIPQPVAWITCHHGLSETDEGGLLGLGRDI